MGIHAATGDVIAMLDGDDYWLTDHLRVVAGQLDVHTEAVLAFSPTEAFGSQNWVWPIRIASDTPVDCFWDCIPRTIIPQMNVVMRRSALRAIGGYRETLKQSQDYDLFLRLAYGQRFVCTQQVTSRYRRHEGSITLRNPHNSMHCMYLSRHLLAQELAEKASPKEMQKFSEICLNLWETALASCVLRRNWRLMDFHLSQAQYVGGSESALLGWKIRRAAGTLQWMWDLANRPFKSTLIPPAQSRRAA